MSDTARLPALESLVSARIASRIFARDINVFARPDDAGAVASVKTRLGWLGAAEDMQRHVDEVLAFAAAAASEGLTDVYLLGMGGSSLCAEVLRDVPLARPDRTRLTVLDTTDEHAVLAAAGTLVPSQSLFIVASKSGGTIEVTSLEQYFRAIVEKAMGAAAGRHFVAITDPGTSLVAHAKQAGYRHTFINPADIGGRYSALSLFGLVPAALLGIDIRALLASAAGIAKLCRADAPENPGLALGAFMGDHARQGRDKLTLLVPAALAPLGVWIEQLVAESTGKLGKGVLPVVGEPLGDVDDYGSDRAFVAILTEDAHDLGAMAARVEAAGHPVFRIDTAAANLGGEFFRWEFATAVAGAALDLNPFDEPNVRDAKMRTQAQLDTRRATGTFTLNPPLTPGAGYSRREHQPASLGTLPSGRYLAVLDYLPANPHRAVVIAKLRGALRHRLKLATTYGIGPRYLHSTGQYHKGGPNTGIFLLLTAADATETVVPGTDYTFSTLKQAQALGDFDALVAAGREVVHIHFDHPATDLAVQLETIALGLG